MELTEAFHFLEGDAVDAAQRLLGCVLEREIDGKILRVRIVETEAYDQTDAASHSYQGKTPRTDVMFGPAGNLYVYFTYGMHYCCNVVTGKNGEGAAVLIRAVEPLSGQDSMLLFRPRKGFEMTNGPAKLCQALRIDKTLNGHALDEPPLRLIVEQAVETELIVQTARIGISREKDRRWRFYIAGNPYVSRP